MKFIKAVQYTLDHLEAIKRDIRYYDKSQREGGLRYGSIAIVVELKGDGGFTHFDGDDIDVVKKANKTRRLSTIVVAVALTIATIIHVVTVVATPDIQVIMEVINK